MPPKKKESDYYSMKLDILMFYDQFQVNNVSIKEERKDNAILHRLYINGKFLLEKQIAYTLSSVISLEDLEIVSSYNKYISHTAHRKMTLEFILAPEHKNLIIAHHKKVPQLLSFKHDTNFAIMHQCITNAVVADLMDSGYFRDFE